MDIRAIFEAALLCELKEIAANHPGMVASRNKLKIKQEKKVVAELFFDHLARVDSYVLGGMVYGGPIFNCASDFEPPYKSNLYNKGCFSFVTSGENSKRFSGGLCGVIKTPPPDLAGQVCDHIRSVLEEFYIPRMLGCIVPSERTIPDALMSPDDYAYPAVFIHCAMALNPKIASADILNEVISSKKVVKNEDYDLPLLVADFVSSKRVHRF